MLLLEQLPWVDPIALAQGVPADESCWALLHSGMRAPYTGRYSILALKPRLEVKSHNFEEFASLLQQPTTNNQQLPYANAFIGYLGYGLRHALESLPADAPGMFGHLPPLWMAQYSLLLVFDHDIRHIEVWAENRDYLQFIPDPRWPGRLTPPPLDALTSNMGKPEYLNKVSALKEAIARGDISQANLTRKFTGQFLAPTRPIELFDALCTISPSPYSAFLKCRGTYIMSSSPERFLAVSAEGMADARPIKGSAPRHPESPSKDTASRAALEDSEKDKAENLMIVDLMRNDFSRACELGSVTAENLFEVTSYATVHHMSSTVRGRLHADTASLELVKACFPPGSMTGTPKIKAMQLCSELEQVERGVYSGAIGWFGGDGSVDLSVVIRTIITDGLHFEFQVGGAITADSDPEAEWRETMVKARALCGALGIGMEMLESI